jgi:hypothetical protein
MKKVFLSDNSGRFFDLETAKAFNQRTAETAIRATLFMTSSGKWIKRFTYPLNQNDETFTEISEKDAARWFLNQRFPDNEIPAELTEAIKEFQL